jgi:hypothetical protein
MYAVTGTWVLDDAMRERQRTYLPGLVESVSQLPGFVRGFWADDVEDRTVGVTFVVFRTLEQARQFHTAVLANAPAQAEAGVGRNTLRIVELQGEA